MLNHPFYTRDRDENSDYNASNRLGQRQVMADKGNIILTGALVLGALLIGVSFLPGTPSPETRQFLPWDIQATDAGSTTVFGLTLDATTLGQAERILSNTAEVTMFQASTGTNRIEAYFDKVMLGGFPAQLILVMNVPQARQREMQARGLRLGNLGAGRKKITLTTADLQTVRAAPITSITYLTRARLDPSLLRKRFGTPAQQWSEANAGTRHWLYPDQGLDVAMADNGSAVLQYVSPLRFNTLTAALRDSAANLESLDQH